jgi:hypothetical protein
VCSTCAGVCVFAGQDLYGIKDSLMFVYTELIEFMEMPSQYKYCIMALILYFNNTYTILIT